MAQRTLRLVMAAVCLAAGMALLGCERKGTPIGTESGAAGGGGLLGGGGFKGIDITGADYAKELNLPDADGKPRSLAEFKGQVLVVFFGYTHCPDVCPTTLAEIAEVKKRLGADGARVRPIFVSVDPQRDTPEVLKAYVVNFGPDFVALRGTPEQTQAAARQFKVFYAKVPGKTEDSYTVDHTAGSYVFDAKGQVRLFTRYGTGPDALASDLKLLLAEGA